MAEPGEILGRIWILISGAVSGVSKHRSTVSAAAMSYYALLSLFPVAIVLAAIAGLVFDQQSAHRDAVDFLLENLPLSEDEGTREEVNQIVSGVTRSAGTLGLIGLATLTVTASGLISATRNAIDIIFGGRVTRGMLRGKALDVALVIGLGLLMLISMVGALIFSAISAEADGFVGAVLTVFNGWSGVVIPLLLVLAAVTVAYQVLPVDRQPLRNIWPAVVFTTIAFELLRRGFDFYLGNFADYSAIYGSLGAVIAFMIFVYLGSLVFLAGAEIASLWPRLRDGDLEEDDDGESKTIGEKVRALLHGLVARNDRDS